MTPDDWAEYGEDLEESWDSADSSAYMDGLERGEADAAAGRPYSNRASSGPGWSGYWDGWHAKSAATRGAEGG